MKSKDLANHILTTGESGYKTKLDGEEISDRMAKLIDQHVQEQLNLLRVNERYKLDLIALRYVMDLAEKDGNNLSIETATIVAKDYCNHVLHFIENAR